MVLGPLTIGDLSARTGVSAATLRSWEERFGFPTPDRSAGGQRRYSEQHVAQVRRLLAERDRGLGLAAAVGLVTRDDVAERSLFSDLRAAHPHLDVMTVGLRVMRALTFAIEDECLAQTSRPLLLGCFQDVASFDRAGGRWRELARRARRAVVLTDFDETRPDTGPERVALPADSPLLEEWGVVCDAAELSVALVGWERPRERREQRRQFEALVSTEPTVVRDAAARYVQVAREAGLRDPDELLPPVAGREQTPARSMSLLRRFAVYSDS